MALKLFLVVALTVAMSRDKNLATDTTCTGPRGDTIQCGTSSPKCCPGASVASQQHPQCCANSTVCCPFCSSPSDWCCAGTICNSPVGNLPGCCKAGQSCIHRDRGECCGTVDEDGRCCTGRSCGWNSVCCDGQCCDRGQGLSCQPTGFNFTFCGPPGSVYCPAHEDGYCQAGETCVHAEYCMPFGDHLCDGKMPLPWCEPDEICIKDFVCAPPNSTFCYNSTFPNGTRTQNFCAPGWMCDHEVQPHTGANATCEWRNVCSDNPALSNVCAACSKDYITTQASCDACVSQFCAYCDPAGPHGCLNSCPKCCYPFIDNCDACVKEECGHGPYGPIHG